ncbi:MAG: class E sortase [Tepidanaerobacteraceae bacterium]|nr:class E sortase [Tepidanaerobacteraceae bacterium]
MKKIRGNNSAHKNIKLNIISYLLIIIGVLLALYPFLSYLYSINEQAKLQEEMLLNSNNDIPNEQTIKSGTDKPEEEEVVILKKNIKDNTSMKEDFPGALLEIPALKLSVAVVKGTSANALKKGVGWYEKSALPGKGNTAIAGHRNCHGSWFLKLDTLKPGDLMNLSFNEVEYIYEVKETFVVSKYDWSVIEPCEYTALTLTTCHPLGSTEKRLIVRGKLKNSIKNENKSVSIS